MKTRIFASVLLSILLHACAPSGGHTSQMLLTKADSTIRIPIGHDEVSTSRNIRSFLDHGKEYLAVENNTLRHIDVYDLTNLSHFKTIVPKQEGANGVGKFFGFDIVNFDSIFLTTQGYGHRVCLIDSATTLKKNIDIESSFTPYYSFAVLWSSYGISVRRTKNGLLFPKELRDEDKYFDNHLYEAGIGYIDVNTSGKCTDYEVKFPDMRNRSPKIYNSGNCVVFNGPSSIVSFQKGHQIFVLKDTIWEEHNAKSKYFKQEFKGKTPSASIVENMEKYAQAPRYNALIYDTYRNVYYRIAYPGVEVREGDNLMEMGEFRTLFSVMVLDEDFNVVDELLMPENTYNINMFFINEAGLWFSTNHVQNPDFEEDAINFQLFTLEYTS